MLTNKNKLRQPVFKTFNIKMKSKNTATNDIYKNKNA